MQFTAAILNGGNNSRMGGKPKDLLKLKDSTLISNQIKLLSSLFDEIIIIGKPVEDYKNLGTYKDIYRNSGPLAGIHTALLNSRNDYTFIFSCDLPFISLDLISAMQKKVSQDLTTILVPKHDNGIEPLHSVYHKSIISTIECQLAKGNFKIRSMFNLLDIQYFNVNLNIKPEISFFNINKPEDLIKAQEYAKRFKY